MRECSEGGEGLPLSLYESQGALYKAFKLPGVNFYGFDGPTRDVMERIGVLKDAVKLLDVSFSQHFSLLTEFPTAIVEKGAECYYSLEISGVGYFQVHLQIWADCLGYLILRASLIGSVAFQYGMPMFVTGYPFTD